LSVAKSSKDFIENQQSALSATELADAMKEVRIGVRVRPLYAAYPCRRLQNNGRNLSAITSEELGDLLDIARSERHGLHFIGPIPIMPAVVATIEDQGAAGKMSRYAHGCGRDIRTVFSEKRHFGAWK